ncbi:amine oxidase B [Trichonephila clavata]|uniref:Amine oxidase n=1 Tax=Trichonephila clavata TaxID=2740835 RepID=A0A8X6GL85_TRICU|nr:amine oxidase B [Trichonephila clavata]
MKKKTGWKSNMPVDALQQCYHQDFLQDMETIRAPIDRMHFAGTETATKWSGYLDGAVEAGERAAREVLYRMRKITKDQIWVEEPPSQEVIPEPFEKGFIEKCLPTVEGFLTTISLSTVVGAAAILYFRYPKYFTRLNFI